MVYGAIVEQGEKYYTDLGKVFRAIENEQIHYNWLITDCVCYPRDAEIDRLLAQKYCWLTGEELTKMVEKESFQWIWAVLSGFEKDIELSEVLKYPLPYADGYEGFWQNPISMQNPLASIEIVPWDSSLALILSNNQLVIEKFMKGFPLSESLKSYNAK